ncbi:cell division protein SepF [Insulibacter thermoxylanivorax]|uniref:Cell division protein SepF n=1 Tax=Insulibacter thermoxylanivorax TaxID=2749268 RepID=A0A916QDN7_9BACL|nr:cell division protein SepF [Insulibacter thermoxylanivorax]GFR37483.1 cell division protein SepF [Insulibacter thermoxylanivorax]
MGLMNKIWSFIGLQDEEDIVERERIVEEEPDYTYPEPRRTNKNNVVSLHTQRGQKMYLCEPRSYEEAQEMADHLRSRRSVVCNLQRVRPDQAVRIVDFLSGTVYALNGTIAKVGTNIFVCTPDNVEVQGTITDMFEEGSYSEKR